MFGCRHGNCVYHMENENERQMTVEELLAKKLSNEIDVQVLTEVLKQANVSEEEIQVNIEKLIDSQDTEFERQFMGGTKQIHGDIL